MEPPGILGTMQHNQGWKPMQGHGDLPKLAPIPFTSGNRYGMICDQTAPAGAEDASPARARGPRVFSVALGLSAGYEEDAAPPCAAGRRAAKRSALRNALVCSRDKPGGD